MKPRGWKRFQKWIQEHHPSGLLFFALCLPGTAAACTVSKTPAQNFYFLPAQQKMGLFFEDPELGTPGPTLIEGCKESVGQYLMVSLPVRMPKPGGRTADLFFNKPFRPDPCRLTGSPFDRARGATDRVREIERQYTLIRRCTYFDVVELEGKSLAYPEQQPAALVERVTRSHVRFRGDLFFLQIQKNNRFAVGIGLNRECANPEVLARTGIIPGEASALLNTYIAGDASGLTTDLTAIGSSPVRVLMSPPGSWIRASSADGAADSPVWPDLYRLEVGPGSLEIRPQRNNRLRLDFSPVVDRPEGRDAPFFLPLAGELVLSDLNGKGHRVLDSWFFGGVVQPAFQGFIPGLPRTIRLDSARPGSRYRLELIMGDPNQDFRLFKSGLKQLLIDLRAMFALPGEDMLEALSGVMNLSGIGALNGLPVLAGGGPDEAMDQALRSLTLSGPPPAWPPYYRETCVGPQSRCVPIRQTRRIRHFGIEFDLGPVSPAGTHLLENPVFFDEFEGIRQERIPPDWPALDCSPPSWN
jgi:hypothetical protein